MYVCAVGTAAEKKTFLRTNCISHVLIQMPILLIHNLKYRQTSLRFIWTLCGLALWTETLRVLPLKLKSMTIISPSQNLTIKWIIGNDFPSHFMFLFRREALNVIYYAKSASETIAAANKINNLKIREEQFQRAIKQFDAETSPYRNC